MAEDAPGIQNKRLLIDALVLGAIVVLVYNVHLAKVRQQGKGKTIELVKFARDMTAGQEIRRQDLEVEAVAEAVHRSLGNVVTKEDVNWAVCSASRGKTGER